MKTGSITYQMIDKDWQGLDTTPYLGVSIDGSRFVPVKQIMQRVLDLSDITLKSQADREAKQ